MCAFVSPTVFVPFPFEISTSIERFSVCALCTVLHCSFPGVSRTMLLSPGFAAVCRLFTDTFTLSVFGPVAYSVLGASWEHPEVLRAKPTQGKQSRATPGNAKQNQANPSKARPSQVRQRQVSACIRVPRLPCRAPVRWVLPKCLASHVYCSSACWLVRGRLAFVLGAAQFPIRLRAYLRHHWFRRALQN